MCLLVSHSIAGKSPYPQPAKTLLQILVEELPKTAFGWPPKAVTCRNTIGNPKYKDCLKVLFSDEKGNTLGFDIVHTPLKNQEVITREQYEAAVLAATTQATITMPADGWIEWVGGECPVQEGVLVEVKYRNEKDYHIKGFNRAGRWSWAHYGAGGDIIAYRLHQQQEAEQAESDDEADLNDCIGQTPAPVWNGEGLPPVGVEFEYGSHRSRAKCLAHGLHYVFASKGNPDDEESDYEELLIDAGTEYYPVDEERAAIRKVIKAAGITSTYADKIANALIDAGYSKQ